MPSPSRCAPRLAPCLVALLAGAACADSAAPRPGTVVIRVDGLPAGVSAALTLSGASASAHTIGGSATLDGLAPGEYRLTAAAVTARESVYSPAISSATLHVRSGLADTVNVAYVLATGALVVVAGGLPDGTVPLIALDARGAWRALASLDTTRGLVPGRYTVRAEPVSRGGTEWVATPATQEVDVRAAEAPTITAVHYHLRRPLDLVVDDVTLTQSVQQEDGSVPLVAGKPALLRVFVRASELTPSVPRVRISWYVDGAIAGTQTLEGAMPAPVMRTDGVLASTWNTSVPGSVIQPGLSLRVEVDPDDAVPETDESNNAHPAKGTRTLDVRAVPDARVRLVPVTVDGVTGAVGEDGGNLPSLAARTLPLGRLDVDVRMPFASAATALLPSDANGAWMRVLEELLALRALDGSDATYYGVVRAPYAAGIAGLAIVGMPVAVGWDAPGTGPQVLAHELGHTWGRLHAPCGSISGVDPAYPDASGAIGAWGFDASAGRLRVPESPDLMSYCGDPWVSAYTFTGIMEQREIDAARAAVVSSSREVERAALLVWGRVTPAGRVLLEPAFEVRARPSLPPRAGAHRVRGLAADGTALFDVAFDAARVADAPSGEGVFAFTVPLDENARARLQSLGVVGRDGERTVRRAVTASETRVDRQDGVRRVRWDAASYPAALVRDATTGRVLGFARNGSASLSAAGAVELVLSDGVRSRVVRVE